MPTDSFAFRGCSFVLAMIGAVAASGCSSDPGASSGKGAAPTSTNATSPPETKPETTPATKPETGGAGAALADGGGSIGQALDALEPEDTGATRTSRGVDAGTPSRGAAGTEPTASPSTDGGTPSDTTPLDAGAVDGRVMPVPYDATIGGGHVVYLYGAGWNRIAAAAGGSPASFSAVLDGISPGKDSLASLSDDGAWTALNTNRFGCSGDCLGVGSNDPATVVLVPGVVPSGRPVMAPGGNLVVYPASGGPHAMDLYALARTGVTSGATWGTPVLLTGGSSRAFHHDPSISYDGTRVAFDCGPTPYQANESAICDVALDGTGLRVVVTPEQGPGGTSANETHHPGYAPDGSIVFEADWEGNERIWRIAAGGGAPTLVSPAGVNDDNSPCVLPDGRIASLWLGRTENAQSYHELKVMNADGSGGTMIVTGVDIVDVGLSCGR